MGRDPEFARTPPQDLVAEQSVLGGMMLSKDAIADVVEVLRGVDFYRPAHESIYEAIVDLYGRGEPADAVTVSDLLTKRGEIARIGGPAYLHTLIQSVPTAANAGFYAEIVRERAVLRRLVDAGTKIVQLGYSQDGEVDAIVNQAQAEIYAVAERRTAEDYVPLKDIIEGTVDEIESAGHRGEGMTGVPTGFYELDELTQGLHPGQMIVIAARPAVGKALALDTPLPTPQGWTTMGEVRAGDEVLAADGTPTTVVAVTDVMMDRPCFEVTFDDGSTLVADAEHQWLTETNDDDAAVVTTSDIAASMSDGGRVFIRNQAPELAEELRYREGWKIVEVREVASVPVRCIQVAHESHLYLAGRSFIPTHNSTFALDFARSAAIKHNMTTVFFSLEMGRNEIAMRLLSAEATIGLQDLRKGTIKDEQWGKIATTMGRMNDAPLFIDDSPNMSLMEIRAKCRRLKQRHDLKLIVLDYLQLMSSGKRVESRQQEVSEFSRALKLLAKELEVPVIALSQLNRGSEQRTDKKPMVSDLRESGCLTADTRVLRSDTGAETTMGELFASGAKDVPVWSLDESLRYVERHLTHVFSTGVKPVYKLTLASGKTVRATANHPFLTYEGWRPLGELAVGDRLGVPRHVNGPSERVHWDDSKVIMLAHLIGDGSFVKRQPIRYATKDEANVQAVTKAAEHFGIAAVRDDYAVARCTTLRLPAPYRLTHGKRNPIASWLDELGLFGARSHEKFVPSGVFALPKAQISLFLRHLWATDGSVTVNKAATGGRIYYASTSRRLVDDVARLLLRFGISARIKTATPKPGYRSGYTLDISGVDDQRRFLQEIGVHGARSANCDRLLEIVREKTANTNVDTVPIQVWNDVRTILEEKEIPHRQFQAALGTQYCGSTLFKSAPSRQRMGRIAEILGSAELDVMAVNDLLWDGIVSIVPDGEEEVFDATVLGNHNFVANGIAVHNSIEQDADMVILLHREDIYDKESPRAGEADVIVAKHRNGPTKTIVVGFQGHYSRFANMAVEHG
ncbi:replicative DNA helicase [Arthrobacter mobilis]|uniref:Replicative DNA helicase n=1 Tax=Arthrobacter mobilis TaxID=2724944 RepID=A0A7X6HH90_9MICC|nr:replicative DNA helicase [Arthrobacter mobilis]NKX55622.1 replicative DNA helicase [Arthrobacter mobilis]